MEQLWITQANILDVESGNSFTGDILCQDGIIVDISSKIACPSRAEVVDLKGKTILPGLFDCHVHLANMESVAAQRAYNPTYINNSCGYTINALRFMEKLIASGITYVRDLGGRDYIQLELREGVKSGKLLGPDIATSGKMINMTGGHTASKELTAVIVDSPDEARRAARTLLRDGVDWLKVMASGGVMSDPGPQLSKEEIQAVCEVAHFRGKKVSSHAQSTKSVINSLLAGVDCIEHGVFLDDMCIRYMKEQDSSYVPTVSAFYGMTTMRGNVPDAWVDKAQIAVEAIQASIRMADQAGIRIAMGTDAGTAGNPRDNTPNEVVLLAQAGLSNLKAIQSTTIRAAEVCGVQAQCGSISVGKRANFSVFAVNPLDQIESITQNLLTVKDGKIVYQK